MILLSLMPNLAVWFRSLFKYFDQILSDLDLNLSWYLDSDYSSST